VNCWSGRDLLSSHVGELTGNAMATELYKERLVIWNSDYNKQTDAWIPDVIISWREDGKYQFHRLKGPPQISHDAALQLAKTLAEGWVDEKL
jgi:hypothetical protein